MHLIPKLYRFEELPIHAPRFSDLPYARGQVDVLLPSTNGSIQVAGWLLSPEGPVDAVEVHLDEQYLFTVPLNARPDVEEFHAWFPYATHTGFDFALPVSRSQWSGTTRLDLVASSRGVRRVRLSQLVRSDIDQLPSPPEEYIFRVSHTRAAHSFKVSGLKTFGDILEPLGRHAKFRDFRRILDWGCGCGRVTMHFLALSGLGELMGCDIDGAAVRWAAEVLSPARFSVLAPMPPSSYPDAHFDLIYSYSVFTHLQRDVQRAWLEEMHRLLAPRGMFVATTRGQLALEFGLASRSATFPSDGIVDAHLDPMLDSVAPKDYYRTTYQSRDYTCREFGKLFEILEYVERGANNLQDVVVMRKC